jgi:hypothetical protein
MLATIRMGCIRYGKRQWRRWATSPAVLLCATVLGQIGCSPARAPASGAEESTRSYVVKQRDPLEREIAAGTGEHLATLALLARCPDTPTLGRALKARQSEIFPAPDADAVAERVLGILSHDPSLHCGLSAQPKAATPQEEVLGAKPGTERAVDVADQQNMKQRSGGMER